MIYALLFPYAGALDGPQSVSAVIRARWEIIFFSHEKCFFENFSLIVFFFFFKEAESSCKNFHFVVQPLVTD